MHEPTLASREHGATREAILHLLRCDGPLTASDLSHALGIGPVGVRQHLSQLEADGLVRACGVRRGIGRPSTLYTLTEQAEARFPKHYDRMVVELVQFVEQVGGEAALCTFAEQRASQLEAELRPLIGAGPLAERVRALANELSRRGYMCEVATAANGDLLLIEHNCPIDGAARCHGQFCQSEQALYERLLGVRLARESTIVAGDSACCYRALPHDR